MQLLGAQLKKLKETHEKIKSLYNCCISNVCATLKRGCQRLEVVIIRRKHNREFLSNLILRDIQGRKKYIIITLQ